MRIWSSLEQVKQELSILKAYTAVTIGNFDGVHRGHQTIIHRTVQLAKAISGQAVVVSFASHTETVLGKQPQLLNQPAIRRNLLDKLGVDVLLEIEFNRQFATLSPEAFFQTWLIEGLKARAIVIGYDFRFGAEGRGDFNLLQNLNVSKQLMIEQIPPVLDKGAIISSSKIRQLITEGEIELANSMLGYPFEIMGEVVPGEQRGRSLGFPTANIHLAPEYLLPAYGVYFVSFAALGKVYYGVASVGVKPTFGVYSPLIEVYLLDTTVDLYHKDAKVSFLRFIRPEIRFQDSRELINQITQDVESAKRLLKLSCF
jgi:riboflavin kinase / FMN adenylyltransferase